MQYFFGRREQHVWRSFFSLLFAERPARTLPQGISSTEKANTTIVAWAELRVKIIWYQKISANGACQIFASFLPKKWSAENFLPKNWSAQNRVCSLFSTTFKRWWIITFFFERWCRLKETKLYSRRSPCPAGEETPGARGSLGKDTSNAIKFNQLHWRWWQWHLHWISGKNRRCCFKKYHWREYEMKANMDAGTAKRQFRWLD